MKRVFDIVFFIMFVVGVVVTLGSITAGLVYIGG